MRRVLGLFWVMVGVVLALVVGACVGGGELPALEENASETVTAMPVSTAAAEMTATPTSQRLEESAATVGATVSPTQVGPTPTAAATSTSAVIHSSPTPAEALRTGVGYDSVANMYRLFSGEGHDSVDSLAAIELAVVNGDKSMVPLMIEMLRYYEDYVLAIESRKALAAITGREVEGNEGSWSSWMEWLASNAEEYGSPEGYLGWKMELMSLISPRFREFLAPAAQGSAVNLIELAWGGVEPDGIPDLRNAPVVSAEEQDYLRPGDRVFGVSINGEHRAYPLRIVNAHEMANDVLGGEPIALAY